MFEWQVSRRALVGLTLLAVVVCAAPNWGAESPFRAGNKKILEALAAPTRFEFIDTPLEQVILILKEMHEIEIVLDQKTLGDLDIDTHVPITQNLKNVSLNSALRYVLSQLGLRHVVFRDVVLITSEAEAKRLLERDAIDPTAMKMSTSAAAAEKIAAALKRTVSREFVETPLDEVVSFLCDSSGVVILLDVRALEAANIPTDLPSTVSLKNASLDSALRLLLREIGLTFVVADDLILITTPQNQAVEERTWTDIQKRQIRAAFVRADGDKVVLLKDGKEYTLPLQRLCEADQAYVRSQATK